MTAFQSQPIPPPLYLSFSILVNEIRQIFHRKMTRLMFAVLMHLQFISYLESGMSSEAACW